MDLISVIVPVYNVEKYIIRCVNSILMQTYEYIEILLIDDGSQDLSGKICDILAQSYKNVYVFHKENGGLSDARNYGLKYAKGRFIGFIDADDWIDKDYYNTLLKQILMNKADIVSSTFRRTSEENVCKNRNNKHGVKYDTDNAQIKYLEDIIRGDNSHASSCTKLYRRECIGSSEFEKGLIHEDVLFNWSLLLKEPVVYFSNYCGYNYYTNSESITEKRFSRKALDLYKVSYMMKDIYKGQNAKVIDLLDVYNTRAAYSIFAKQIRTNYEDDDILKESYVKTKRGFKKLITSSMSVDRKIILIAIKILPFVFWKKMISK